MKKLINSGISLAHFLTALGCCVLSLHAHGGTDTTYLRYQCESGEKPGSPSYELILIGYQYHVERISSSLPGPDSHRTAQGTVSKRELSELLDMTPRLISLFDSLNKLPAPAEAGYCRWKIESDGKTATAVFQNVRPLEPEFKGFLQWIKRRTLRDANNRWILPVIPGEPTPWKP